MTAKPHKSAKLKFSDLQAYRQAHGENQAIFWRRFGVTQSGGSRYESGREVPPPTQLLLALFDMGALTEDVLEKARKAIAKAK